MGNLKTLVLKEKEFKTKIKIYLNVLFKGIVDENKLNQITGQIMLVAKDSVVEL